jgi:rRNA maturation endonuclease Nob1
MKEVTTINKDNTPIIFKGLNEKMKVIMPKGRCDKCNKVYTAFFFRNSKKFCIDCLYKLLGIDKSKVWKKI